METAKKKETKQLWDLNELKRLQYCVEAEDLEEVEKVIDSYFLKWKDVTLDDMELLQVQLLNIYFYFTLHLEIVALMQLQCNI